MQLYARKKIPATVPDTATATVCPFKGLRRSGYSGVLHQNPIYNASIAFCRAEKNNRLPISANVLALPTQFRCPRQKYFQAALLSIEKSSCD